MMSNKWLVSPLLSIALLLIVSLAVAACGPQPAGTTSASSVTNQTTNNSTTATTATTTNSTPSAVQTASNATTPTTSGAKTTSTTPTTSNSTTSNSTSSSSPSMQKCGTISMSPLQLQEAAPAQQVGGCFWQAYQQCSPASMTVNANGMDTTTSHSLLIAKKNGSCMIVDTLSKELAPKPATVTTYTCSGMTNSNGTLHLTGCGAEGDIIIPLH